MAPKPKTILIHGRKSTMRLDPIMWQALGDIAGRFGISLGQLIEQIDLVRRPGEGLTQRVRVYIVEYYLDLTKD
jgi:predicted DNA-binding ribbon-helix-helix protein